jgi:hypothetical protein
MADDDAVEIPGFEELIRALEETPEKVLPMLVRAMGRSVRAVQSRVDVYPASTEANQPGRISVKTHRPMGYYERGRGWWYPVMKPWTMDGQKFGKALGVLKSGAKKVRKATGVQGYKLAGGGESENLGKSWTVAVTATKSSVLGEIGNNTSYAPWVQGGQQAGIHKARNWITIDQALTDSTDDIVGFFDDALDEWKKTLPQS